MRIATGFQNQTALSQIQKNNEELAKQTFQISTGLRANKLSGMAGDAAQLLDLQDVQKKTDMYVRNIDTASNRLKSTESALQSMNDLLVEATSLATLGRNENTASSRAALAPKAQSIAETFFSLLNTEFDGRFIFAGQNGGEAATSATATATAFPGSPVPTTYYDGDSQQTAIITGPGQTFNYGVTGDDNAMAKLKAGLEALWFGLENNSLTDMDSAISVMEEAQSDLSSLIGEVGGQLSNLDLQKDRHDNQKLFLQEQVDQIDKIDVAEALTNFSQQQATIEASMLVITRVNNLSLLDFLR